MSKNYTELIRYLTSREIKARYKQSVLGLFWVILNPFFQMLIMSFVFSSILRIVDLGVPYPIFLFVGFLPWVFFSTSITSSMDVLIGNGLLIKKIYFPRQILVMSTVVAKAFDLLLASLVLVAMMFYFQIGFSWYALLIFPIFGLQMLFTYALSLLLSSLNLFFRDVQYLFNLVLTAWFYLTPIMYSVEFFPEKYRFIFKLNPMSVFINAYRQVLLTKDWPNWTSLGIGLVMSLGLLFFSNYLFKKLESSFADMV